MLENHSFSITENRGLKTIAAICLMLPWGSYDGAEICELVGLFTLNHLGKTFGKENMGLYRDDGLAIIKKQISTFVRQNEKRAPPSFRTI